MKSQKTPPILRRTLIAVVLGLVVWAGFHEFLRRGCYFLRIEPRYEGKTLSYWCEHAYDYHGSHESANPKAVEAIHVMKNDAIPFLVKWIATINHSTRDSDYKSLALRGFKILGTNASPAIPGLIKVIGRNSNWPSSALCNIGPAAVPALIEVLATNRVPDFYGNWRKGIPDNTVREHAVEALSGIGTNAQAALPLLLDCYKDEESRSRANMASALASVGHNRPDLVVPALTYLLTNSSRWAKFEAPSALASFRGAAKSAIPELVAVSQTADDQFKAEIGIAIKQIEPERPDMLLPLLNNLTSEDANLRNNALFEIERLGTHGLEVLGGMRKMATREPSPYQRTRILDWLVENETNKEELAKVALINLTNDDESVSSAAVRCIGALAEGSETQFGELLKTYNSLRNKQVRGNAEICLCLAMRKHPEYLIACLNNSQGEISDAALNFIHGLCRDTLVKITYSLGISTNEQWYTMKEIRGGDKRLLNDSIPILVEKLRAEKLETRQFATNILLALDPKAAKQAGVHVKMPYSYYAE